MAWFLAGLAAGYLISSRQAEPAAWMADAEHLQETFQLSAKRRYVLNQVLDHHDRELQEIERRHFAQTREAMEPEIRALFSRTDATIRDTIIPPAQRERFDELRRPRVLIPER
ncbi:hypothetical protein [Planctomycetes bacterium Poly30]